MAIFSASEVKTPVYATEEDPIIQAERDRLMPQACGTCGAEVVSDGATLVHFDWCLDKRKGTS